MKRFELDSEAIGNRGHIAPVLFRHAINDRSGYSSVTGCVLTQAIRPALQNLEYF